MKPLIVKRSVAIAGHKTSVSLEDAFWNSLKKIANERDITPSDLIGEIDSERQHGKLSSAIRVFVLDFYRRKISVEQAAPSRQGDRKSRERPSGSNLLRRVGPSSAI